MNMAFCGHFLREMALRGVELDYLQPLRLTLTSESRRPSLSAGDAPTRLLCRGADSSEKMEFWGEIELILYVAAH